MAADTSGSAPPALPQAGAADQGSGQNPTKLARGLIISLLVLMLLVLAALATIGVGAAAGWRECSTDAVRTTEAGRPGTLVYEEHCRPLAVSDPLPLTCLVLAGVLAVPFLLITADTLEFEGFGIKVAATRARRNKKKVAGLGDQVIAAGQNALASDEAFAEPPAPPEATDPEQPATRPSA